MQDLATYEKRLTDERATVLGELREAGTDVSADGHKHWEPKVADIDSMRSDVSDVADRLETYEENAALIRRLSGRLAEIDTALAQIKKNPKQFGICRVCGKEIEESRLKVNPAATTCKEHLRAR